MKKGRFTESQIARILKEFKSDIKYSNWYNNDIPEGIQGKGYATTVA